jgi:hypothetical protein
MAVNGGNERLNNSGGEVTVLFTRSDLDMFFDGA